MAVELAKNFGTHILNFPSRSNFPFKTYPTKKHKIVQKSHFSTTSRCNSTHHDLIFIKILLSYEHKQ